MNQILNPLPRNRYFPATIDRALDASSNSVRGAIWDAASDGLSHHERVVAVCVLLLRMRADLSKPLPRVTSDEREVLVNLKLKAEEGPEEERPRALEVFRSAMRRLGLDPNETIPCAHAHVSEGEVR